MITAILLLSSCASVLRDDDKAECKRSHSHGQWRQSPLSAKPSPHPLRRPSPAPPLTRRSHFLPPLTRCRRRPRSLEVVCLSVGRSHAWLVRKPDLVWQILTDFLGGRTRTATLRVPASKEHCGKAFLRRRASDEDERTTTQVSYLLRSFVREFVRQPKEHSCSFGLMRLVGMQISSLSLPSRLFADGPADGQRGRPPELER